VARILQAGSATDAPEFGPSCRVRQLSRFGFHPQTRKPQATSADGF
jgi:hypothetical protein